ncbi:MAG TPA: aminodeoxychorismate synthase component I [Vibrio sp.]|uniref:aminodeoxychorismate synthase n=4 Tax=Vibrionaceae TaxID=641 RepID=A0A368LQ57_9VIBR|nr:aminodeoxychorismate synthase component I [Vibrio casei]HBV75499.1 aminodeoxychorismate synthase component I [Vibrio sp.]
MTQKQTTFHQNELSIESHPYSHDLAKHFFTSIHQLPWSMLLRSAAEGHPNNRFDILVAKPIARLVTHGDTTIISIDGPESINITSQDDPFSLLHHYQQTLLPTLDSIEDMPFIGGALGYLSYDLGRRIEFLPTTAQQDIPTADMAFGIYEWALIVDHQKKQAHFVGNNIEQHKAWLDEQIRIHSKLTESKFSLTSNWQANMSKDSYIEKFNVIQEYLRSGDCYQINLAQRFKAHYQGSEWQAYQALESANHAPFSAFLRTDELAVISISPERFLQLNHNKIETKPIKGTRPRSKSKAEDQHLAHELKHAEKDQAENLMIVDLLRNDIGRVAKPGSVSVPALFEVESFPAVHHLVSTIRAILNKDQNSSDLLRACFPGGSITGAPKVRAMAIIEELEPHRRNLYCGSIVYSSRCGNMDSNITIRTLISYQQNLYAWAGGGIVADSNAESEYQETLDKVSRILPVLSSISS